MVDRPVVLVGLMGSGKSSAASCLSRRTTAKVLDTDRMVEQAEGRSVASLFHDEGEAAFRLLEVAALDQALSTPTPVIIAAGGGIVITPEARSMLRERAVVIHLAVSPEVAAARVGNNPSRPLLAGDPLGRLTSLHADRRSLYDEVADHTIAVDELSPDEIAQAVQAIVEDT